MNPRGEVHTHTDPTCNLTWPCANHLCVDPTELWCGKAPQCMGEPALHQLRRVAEVGHILDMCAQDYRLTFNNPSMARRCEELRAQVLTLVEDATQYYRVTRVLGD